MTKEQRALMERIRNGDLMGVRLADLLELEEANLIQLRPEVTNEGRRAMIEHDAHEIVTSALGAIDAAEKAGR